MDFNDPKQVARANWLELRAKREVAEARNNACGEALDDLYALLGEVRDRVTTAEARHQKARDELTMAQIAERHALDEMRRRWGITE